ncbi:MAG: PAS domain S-box protein [Kiritimatiellae bacterium]|nr:PAS domain S-box protein [Kiritimatiellia bacterium]
MNPADRPTRDLCLDALLEHSQDNIYFKDLESRFVLVSRSMARWCGKSSPDELIGRTDADLFAPPHAQEALADEQRLIRRECDVIRKEERETWPDGRETWVSTVKHPLIAPDGRVIGTFGISRDITEQRRAQAEAQAHAQHYAQLMAIVNRSPAVVFEWGPSDDWPVVHVSDNVRRFGIEPEQLLSGRMPYAALVHPEDIDRVRAELAAAVDSGADTYDLEYRFVVPGGPVRYVEEMGIIRRDEAGRVVGYQGIVIDVTRRHEAEEELGRYRARLEDMVADRTRDLEIVNGRLREENARRRASEAALSESEQRYKRLLESVTDYVYTVELRNGRPVATHHGPGCLAVTGYTPEEYAADPYLWIEMVPEEDRDLVRRQSAQVLATGTAEPIEHRLRRKDGAIRWVRSHVAARRDADGRLVGYDGLVKDITEPHEAREAQMRAELEAMQARQRAALERADRLSSLGVLAAGLAHEISNPLQGMLSHLDAVRRALPRDFPRAKNLEMIERGIETIASLVKELLWLGGPSESTEESCVLADGIAFVRDLLANQFQRNGVVLRLEARELHVRLAMPARELIQILLNLLMNARDAMPQGGTITIGAEVRGDRAVLHISDTGCGIPEELLPKIFTPFFTTKGAKGTGLGLTVAESLVRQRNGRIEVRSRPGVGTTFSIELPIAHSADPR